MTYTTEQIHAMSDHELCEAISTARELEPEIPEKWGYFVSYSPDWNWCHYSDSVIGYWQPINWLEWNNAGRLLEEMASSIDSIEVDDRAFEYPSPFICYVIHCIGFAVESDNLKRAICEAWLILWYQEKNANPD